LSLYIRSAAVTHSGEVRDRDRVENEDLENGANIEKQTFVVFSEAYFRSKKDDDEGESFAIESRELL